MVSRRTFLLGASGALVSAYSGVASATVVRALSLPALVASSRHVMVVTALGAESRYEVIGRRRRIVTDTRVRVEELLAKGGAGDTELLVRTLGGAIGRVGERVDGQPVLALGQSCVAFLLQGPDGLHYVNGMAQGHYPLRGSARRRLESSPDLPQIIDFESSAVKVLAGSELGAAAARIRGLAAR